MTTPDIVVAGHICLDVIPTLRGEGKAVSDVFVPGTLVDTGRAVVSTGGVVANTGLGLHKLGVPTRLMGKVGDDLFGKGILDILSAIDPALAEGMLVDPTVDSSYTVILSAPGFDRIFLHCPGANDTFVAADVPLDALGTARIFHFGYPPLMRSMYERMGAESRILFEAVRARGITTSLDLARPDPDSPAGQENWMMYLGMVLPYVDIFMPSLEEILFMLEPDLYHDMTARAPGGDILPLVDGALLDQLAVSLLNMGCAVVGIKLGEHGLYLRTSSVRPRLASMGACAPADPDAWYARELYIPCFQAREVVGTTGAGDTTIAGALAAVLRGESPEGVLQAAVGVGACCVESPDATGGIRPWEEVAARIAAGWTQRPPLPALGEDWTRTGALFVGPNEGKEV